MTATPTRTLTTITMPRLGESVTDGTLGTWLKAIGDPVEKYEALVEIETDKASGEIPAPVSGILAEILVEPGTTVAVGTDLCRIEEATVASPDAADAGAAGEAEPTSGDAPAATNGHARGGAQPTASRSLAEVRRGGEFVDELTLLRVRSSPVVRRLAEENGVDLSDVAGTGVGGRVSKRDLLAYLGKAERAGEAPNGHAATPTRLEVSEAAPRPALVPVAQPEPQREPQPRSFPARAPAEVLPGDEVIPVTAMRRTIAEHMLRSVSTAPHATVVMEVDMTRAVAWRAARKEEFRRREGIDLTTLPLALKAVTLALRDQPRLNAVWDEERIIHRAAINLGVAVALDDGLVVPVIRNADRLSIAGLTHALAELAGKARSRALTPDEMAGGTFTVNNPGTFGSLVSTPILVQPQVGILSTEAIVKRPVVIDDMIAIRAMMNLSLTIDHRALDGLAATRFLQQVKQWLERVGDDTALY